MQTMISLGGYTISQRLSKEIKHIIFQLGEKEAQQGYVIHLVGS